MDAPTKVEFYRHALGTDEKAAVADVLDSLFLTTGEEVYAFEREFAEYLGVERVEAVSSCTAALHLSLLAHDIGPGDEVITTPLTFVSTVNAILYTGATPVLADVEPETGNLSVDCVRAAITERTRAIIAVHLYGTMCDMAALRRLADEHGLLVIEDAAHCVEGERESVRVGELGDAACFSFYATKTLTSGEGGAIAVHDDEVADRIRVLRLHGMDKSAADRYKGPYRHWDMRELGYKCNLTNIQAAMLRPQIGKLAARRDHREAIARRYDAFVDSRDAFDRPRVPENTRSGRHLYTIWVDPQVRDEYLEYLGDHQVGASVHFRAVHELTWISANVPLRFDLPNAEAISAKTISIPFHNLLTDDEMARVCQVLDDAQRDI